MIYQPKGRAREYSPLAANIYEGCDHGCIYCYVPRILRQDRDAYRLTVKPKKDIIERLTDQVSKWKGEKEQVLLSFTGDPYCHADRKERITRQALRILLEGGFPVAILTKGGSRCLQDLDIFQQYKDRIKVGATLTFSSGREARQYEPYSAGPQDRMQTLYNLHQSGVRTWASFEPVIEPDQTIELINQTLDYVDEYKIGKINQFNDLDKYIPWTTFLQAVVGILRKKEKDFYVKEDLRNQAPDVYLTEKESDMNALNMKPEVCQLSLEI